MHKRCLFLHNFFIREARSFKKTAKLPAYFADSQKIKRYSLIVDRLRILKNKIHVYAVLHFYNLRVSRV